LFLTLRDRPTPLLPSIRVITKLLINEEGKTRNLKLGTRNLKHVIRNLKPSRI